nr:MAG TPA: hypothetical protein [Caudoviricetes sp.]
MTDCYCTYHSKRISKRIFLSRCYHRERKKKKLCKYCILRFFERR